MVIIHLILRNGAIIIQVSAGEEGKLIQKPKEVAKGRTGEEADRTLIFMT